MRTVREQKEDRREKHTTLRKQNRTDIAQRGWCDLFTFRAISRPMRMRGMCCAVIGSQILDDTAILYVGEGFSFIYVKDFVRNYQQG